jgi:uncharacterized lipoprotein YmbA
MKSRIPIVLVLVVLAACASTPNLSYYTLDMTPSGRADAGVNLEVEPFLVVESIDRTQIVIQTTPTRIEYYATDRWASSVNSMVQRKLAAEFGPVVEARRTLKVSGRVLAFEQVDDDDGPIGRVKLEVELRDAEAKHYEDPLLERTYEASRAAGGSSVDAVVNAMSRAMEEIAAEIAADAVRQ